MRDRPIRSVVSSLGKLSRKWLDPRAPFRRSAVRRLVRRSGFSERMAEAMVQAVFSELTETKLWTLLTQELKDPRLLDDFRKVPGMKVRLRARGPENILHILPANAPQAAVLSFVLGMLLKSRNTGKLSSRDGGFLDIYLRSLKTVDPRLWRGQTLIDAKDRSAFSAQAKKADLVVAYGSQKSLQNIRKAVPASTPFFGYGHRLSVALYSREVLTKKGLETLARSAARDVWMADQRGCLSPVTIYAQKGGAAAPAHFAERLAAQLKVLQKKEKIAPRRSLQAVLAMQGLRSRSFLDRIKGAKSVFWESSPRGQWAVSYDEDLKPSPAVSSQVISVKGYEKNDRVFSALGPLRKYLQCAALECAPHERKRIAEKLSDLGVNRVCRAGKMQQPPITWHHDGKFNLASWVRWTDLEE